MTATWCRITSAVNTIRRLSTNHSRGAAVVLWLGDAPGGAAVARLVMSMCLCSRVSLVMGHDARERVDGAVWAWAYASVGPGPLLSRSAEGPSRTSVPSGRVAAAEAEHPSTERDEYV